MSKSLYIATMMLFFPITAVMAQPGTSPEDKYAVFKTRVEYGVPMANKIPFLNRLFMNTSKSSYIWDHGIEKAVISANGRYFLTGTRYDGQLSLWDLEEPEKSRQNYVHLAEIRDTSNPAFIGRAPYFLYQLVLTQDGSRFAAMGLEDFDQGKIQIYETETGKCLREIKISKQITIHHLAFSPCGKYLAYDEEDDYRSIVRVMDIEKNVLLVDKDIPDATIKGIMTRKDADRGIDFEAVHKEHVVNMVFSPDGRSLAVCMTYSGTELWNTMNGEVQAHFEHADMAQIVPGFSPDGKKFFVAETSRHDDRHITSKILLWDVASRQLCHQWDIGSKEEGACLISAAFTPDGTQLLTAQCQLLKQKNEFQAHQTISVWDVASGKHVKTTVYENGFGGATPLIQENRPLYNDMTAGMLEYPDIFFIVEYEPTITEQIIQTVVDVSPIYIYK